GGGTNPRCSTGSSPVTSMIGTEAVSATFGASTAPSPTITPSVRMQREPTNAPSSTITGRAPTGSRTPPMPTPPARCTSEPICAHEPTVAHVSTIVRGPTQAPMFTNPGMTTTPSPRNDPYRTTAPGTTRTPRCSWPRLSGILSVYSNGPSSCGSI